MAEDAGMASGKIQHLLIKEDITVENKLEIIHTARLFNHVFKVYGTFEEPLFLAKDVAEWIEYDTSSIHKMLASVDEDEKVRKIVPTPGGPQEMWFLTENGLYEVLMLSRKPVAKLFKREVKRILRELRTRGITATPQTIDRILADPDFGIRLLAELKSEREKSRVLSEKVERDRPKVVFAESLEVSDDCILIGELAKLISQSCGVRMGARSLFEYLRVNGYLIRVGDQRNLPTQRSVNADWLRILERTVIDASGNVRIIRTPKVTGKGQRYFLNLFRERYV